MVVNAKTSPRPRLPGYPDRFIGRESDLERLHRHLLAGPERLCTVTGPGGAGKTRLVLELAQRLQQSFVDGVLFVDLSTVRDATGMVGQVLAVAQAHLPITGSTEFRSADFRSADFKLADFGLLETFELLLVLDNLEQIVGAGPVVVQLLEAAPSVHVLATSRQALAVPGERRFLLRPLGLTAVDGPGEAVQLLLERARAVNADFANTPSDLECLALVAERLDGLPLALELIAARADQFSPQVMLAQLERGFLPARHGRADRQGSLAATIAWSFDLLDPNGQELLCRLGVFTGAFTVDAARMIAGSDVDLDTDLGIHEALYALAERHLLIVDAGTITRFHLLETLRVFALERLEASAESVAIHQRHAQYYATRAQDYLQRWNGSHQAEALHEFEHEQTQFQAALNWWLLHAQTPEEALEAVTTTKMLHIYFGALERFEAMYDNANRLFALLTKSEWNVELHSQVLDAQAQAAILTGRNQEARALLEQASELARSSGDTASLAAALHTLSRLLSSQSEHQAALLPLEEAIALRRTIPDDAITLAILLDDLGTLQRRLGNLDAARNHLSEALELDIACGDVVGRLVTLRNLGLLEADAEQWLCAEQHFRDSLALVHEVGLNKTGGHSLIGLAELLLRQGEYAEAKQLLLEVAPVFKTEADHQGLSSPEAVLLELTELRLDLLTDGENAEARLRAFVRLGLERSIFPMAAACHLFAQLHQRSNRPDLACVWAELGDLALSLRPVQRRIFSPSERNAFDAWLETSGAKSKAYSTEFDGPSLKAEIRHALQASEQVSDQGSDQGSEQARPVTQTDATTEGQNGKLSPREQQIVRFLAEGLTNKAIAKNLELSPATVDTYLKRLFAKLECNTRAQAVGRANELGWV
jgi:predicted ATPase/DNA-binding CsgD family transcriptional regulator